MKKPPYWTTEQLTDCATAARAAFRDERLSEPLERWKKTFDEYRAQFHRLFDEFDIASPENLSPEDVAGIFQEQLGDALRYLAGPPISADDLKVLADASLGPSVLANNPDQAQRLLDTILIAIDPRRFPWVAQERAPTEEEKSAAILASAALITAQRVSTDRRNEGKDQQENAVKDYLVSLGFEEVPVRHIHTLTDAPDIGQFCSEAMVGSRKADVPVRLYDGRLMPIECKVSNSSTNSVKRINNDAAVKAGIWHREFGTNQVIPTAVLTGVFKVHNLEQAQHGGLTLFWAHDLVELGKFIESTKPKGK
ncbi:XamI family restriction endonuclease [Pseudidiomarina gelatinasegens]|uniref:XamI family restriction endonuclease n=1 Tax=Pseudidiomarina gelatinasegens TaxID=2487740 RepID=UPI003A981361